MFKITIESTGQVVAEPASEDDDVYLNDLNKKKWLKEAAQYAQETDFLECPECKELTVTL
jgi:hypothetical protein